MGKRFLSAKIRFYNDKSGSIYLAGTVQDITERKRAEQELLRFSSEVEKNNNELQDALANVKQLTGLLPIYASCKQIRDAAETGKALKCTLPSILTLSLVMASARIVRRKCMRN